MGWDSIKARRNSRLMNNRKLTHGEVLAYCIVIVIVYLIATI